MIDQAWLPIVLYKVVITEKKAGLTTSSNQTGLTDLVFAGFALPAQNFVDVGSRRGVLDEGHSGSGL